MTRPLFILASASPRRLQLLKQVGLTPGQVIPAELDETPIKGELPDKYAARVAQQKCELVSQKHSDAIVLAADTVVACGRRILPKAEDEKTARQCLKLLSGRRHRVYTAVHVIAHGKNYAHTVLTQLKFSRLSTHDIEHYIATNEWHGKAGGYAIQGYAESFIPWINGSYSNVVGLPLEVTLRLLTQAGMGEK